MLNIGSRVYWISSERLCWGEVVNINATRHIDGKPVQIVVDSSDEFRILTPNYGPLWYETPSEAVNTHIEAMLKDALHRQKVTNDLYRALKEVPPETTG